MTALRGTQARALLLAAALSLAGTGSAFASACMAERDAALLPDDPVLCHQLEAQVRDPSALPLGAYEKVLDRYFGQYCHRDGAAGWVRDKHIRATGPFTATLRDGAWVGEGHGVHTPVVIWYSPDMAEWMRVNRPAEGEAVKNPPPVPDGAIMVKEMYPDPASACRDVDPAHLFPANGAAIMVRDAQASHDGWFWGWYGFGPDSGWAPDWPAAGGNTLTNMGFAQYCLNCHASAADNSTFADSINLAGEPGAPIEYLAQDFFTAAPTPSLHEEVVTANAKQDPAPAFRPDPAVLAAFGHKAPPPRDEIVDMPSETYDHTWVGAGGPDASDAFVTSTQCLGCHDAGSTGLQFDMTKPSPHGDGLLENLSPYGTWRTSPMGLAGRDPIFFAQMASETQTFHPDQKDLVETTCLGCHGIQGERQFLIDRFAETGECGDFTREMVNAVPWPADSPGAAHANYGALARDGISCTTCHSIALGKAATDRLADQPQNACVAERQDLLNPHNTGFARTFSGSFLVNAPEEITGPFRDPKVKPMENALGMKPAHDGTITISEVCGTCHTVHLPVLHEGETVGYTYEQATHPEWAFSAYRTGISADGPLPLGAGEHPLSCQDCHMPSREADGSPSRSRIASIQEYSTFPEVENVLPGEDIDLEVREGYSRHTLVGLNAFLVEMARQFPDVLGLRAQDPMLGKKGVAPVDATQQAISDLARNETATIAIDNVSLDDTALSAEVSIRSLTGHKFPSGVGFRRAFITFNVRDEQDEVIWASGRANPAGLLIDANGEPLEGELWWTDDCSARRGPGPRPHQPHFQTVTRQDQAQIYQELVSAPLAESSTPMCGHGLEPQGELTTSFLSICTEVKDNRILPKGYLPLSDREVIAKAMGAGPELAAEAGSTVEGTDPDYTDGGGDRVTYRVALADLPTGTMPASVDATLSYQATPPFYLQDRFCTANGADTDRLFYLAANLDLENTSIESWKLKVAGTGDVPVR